MHSDSMQAYLRTYDIVCEFKYEQYHSCIQYLYTMYIVHCSCYICTYLHTTVDVQIEAIQWI